ncbi:unnamed protein product, partial [Heterosigma akashiwo]
RAVAAPRAALAAGRAGGGGLRVRALDRHPGVRQLRQRSHGGHVGHGAGAGGRPLWPRFDFPGLDQATSTLHSTCNPDRDTSYRTCCNCGPQPNSAFSQLQVGRRLARGAVRQLHAHLRLRQHPGLLRPQ